MTDDKKRGNHLAELRKSKGLKQIDLANLLHYTDKNISKWENGKSFPKDPDVLNKLANTFNVSVKEIIYGEKINEDKLHDEDNLDSYQRNFKKNNKIFFLAKLLFFLIITIIVIFVCYIYINRNNSYYFADIDNSNISKSSLEITFTSKYSNLKFNKIYSSNKPIYKVVFYYMIDNREYVLFESENEDYSIIEYSGYNEYNLERVVKSECYIKIIYNDNSFDIIKLKFKK